MCMVSPPVHRRMTVTKQQAKPENKAEKPKLEPRFYAQLVKELGDPQPVMTVDLKWKAIARRHGVKCD